MLEYTTIFEIVLQWPKQAAAMFGSVSIYFEGQPDLEYIYGSSMALPFSPRGGSKQKTGRRKSGGRI